MTVLAFDGIDLMRDLGYYSTVSNDALAFLHQLEHITQSNTGYVLADMVNATRDRPVSDWTHAYYTRSTGPGVGCVIYGIPMVTEVTSHMESSLMCDALQDIYEHVVAMQVLTPYQVDRIWFESKGDAMLLYIEVSAL